MGEHALLSPSGAERWLNCPASVRATEHLPNETNEYAEEGTKAHALAESMLKQEDIKLEDFDPDMVRYCTMYADYIRELAAGADLYIEQKVEMSEWVPECFGTVDCIIKNPGLLHIVDLKYGMGLRVDATENKQLMLYALGACNTVYEDDPLPDVIKMTIVQPRLDHISTYEISVEELGIWGNSIRDTAQKAYTGLGGFKSGEHCKWCKMKATCRTRAESNIELAKMEFAAPNTLTDDEIGEVLRKGDLLQAWVNDVKDYVFKQALAGHKIQGWKLVEGRAIRRIVDVDKAVESLQGAGYSDIFKPQELKTLTVLEKEVGKKELTTILGGLIEKPPGKATLVPESDKRKEISIAANDFGLDILE